MNCNHWCVKTKRIIRTYFPTLVNSSHFLTLGELEHFLTQNEWSHFLTLNGLQPFPDTKWMKPCSDIEWITAISWHKMNEAIFWQLNGSQPFSDTKWIAAIIWHKMTEAIFRHQMDYSHFLTLLQRKRKLWRQAEKYVDAHHFTLYTKHINSRKSCHLTETDFVKQTLKWIVTSRPKNIKFPVWPN